MAVQIELFAKLSLFIYTEYIKNRLRRSENETQNTGRSLNV